MIVTNNADILAWCDSYKGEKFHALLSDPPYHLHKGGADAKTGFMGKEFDGGDIAFRPETWRKLGEHLHDGAFIMAFASSRGWHRLAVAIEDAGFIIHPTIFGWSFGSGFPKATRIDTQVDGIHGKRGEGFNAAGIGKSNGGSKLRSDHPDYIPYISDNPLAQSWVSHRYGLQALKPALEPIIVAQKPYKGKPVENITRTGAGALNIDGGRIAGEYSCNGGTPGFKADKGWNQNSMVQLGERETGGRWPSNLLLYHTPECKQEGVRKVKSHNPDNQIESDTTKNAYGEYEKRSLIGHADSSGNETIPNWVCHESCPVAKMDKQSGVSKSVKAYRGSGDTMGYGGGRGSLGISDGHNDSGTASRFFHQVQTQLDDADPIRYQAKAAKVERTNGLETPSNHPTHKPIALAKYLATLLLPPKEYAPRRILVPFSGVGSEMIGCFQAGWEDVVGIEMSPEYVEIAEKRIKYYKDKMDNEPQAML